MAIQCTSGGTPHTHNTVLEVRNCYAGVNSPPIRPPAPSAPVASSLSLPGLASEKQVRFLIDLGVPWRAARRVDRTNAHHLIDELLAEKRGTPVPPTPPAAPPPVQPTRQPEPDDPRRDMIKALIGSIPIGYFAVEKGSGTSFGDEGDYNFVRISHPKHGKYRDAIKIQSQHGDRLETRAVLWPSGSLSIFDRRIIDPLMGILADHKTCLMTYGQKLGHCCRCHKALTDDRSRHYGIGPECEKYYPWVIEQVDEQNALA